MEVVASRKMASAWLREGEPGARSCRQGNLIYITVQKDGRLFFEGADPNGQVADRVVKKLPKGKYMVHVPNGTELSLEQAEWYLSSKDGNPEVKVLDYNGHPNGDLLRLKTIVQFKEEDGDWSDHCARDLSSLNISRFVTCADGTNDVRKPKPKPITSPLPQRWEEVATPRVVDELIEVREHLAIDDTPEISLMSKIVAYEDENEKLSSENAKLRCELDQLREAKQEAELATDDYCRISEEHGSIQDKYEELCRSNSKLERDFEHLKKEYVISKDTLSSVLCLSEEVGNKVKSLVKKHRSLMHELANEKEKWTS